MSLKIIPYKFLSTPFLCRFLSSDYLFAQKLLIEHLLSARQCSEGLGGHVHEQNRQIPELMSLKGEG